MFERGCTSLQNSVLVCFMPQVSCCIVSLVGRGEVKPCNGVHPVCTTVTVLHHRLILTRVGFIHAEMP